MQLQLSLPGPARVARPGPGRPARPGPQKDTNSAQECTLFLLEESFCALSNDFRFMVCTFREFRVNLSVELILHYALPVLFLCTSDFDVIFSVHSSVFGCALQNFM